MAQGFEFGFIFGGEVLADAMESVENGIAFPVARGPHVILVSEPGAHVTEFTVDFIGGPDIEFSFFAFAVCVDTGGKGTFCRGHLSGNPGNGFIDAGGIKRVFGFLPHFCQPIDEEGIVVEHLLKMWNKPIGVDGIAGKATAQVIINAAFAHMGEGGGHSGSKLLVTGSNVATPEHVQQPCLWEFGGTFETALLHVHYIHELVCDAEHHIQGWLAACVFNVVQGVFERISVAMDFFRFLCIKARNLFKDLRKARTTEFWLWGKIGAAPEGLSVWGEKHGQRPAALLA